MSSPLHVAVGVVTNADGEILIARRPHHVHQGGLWEFPGGKLEAGETVQQALKRELDEELGIRVDNLQPLIRIPYAYPDRSVLLDVWRTASFSGQPLGREGQPIEWVSVARLDDFSFPAANHAIVRALQLPDRYLITGGYEDTGEFSQKLARALERGIRLVQFRDKQHGLDDLKTLVSRAVVQCHEAGARLLLNGASSGQVEALAADGLHLTSGQLQEFTHRPLDRHKLLAASVHNLTELQQALRLDVDFVVLSPVLPTASHPGAALLGWDGFATLTEMASVPAYALGGMDESLVSKARKHGGQGIAAIRSLWETD